MTVGDVISSAFVRFEYRVFSAPLTASISSLLATILLDFNQKYSDYIGYIQGNEYLDKSSGETVIEYNTLTPGIIFKSFLNGDREDSMIMYIENYQE